MGQIPFRITDSYQVQEAVGRERGGRPCVRLIAPLEFCVGFPDSDDRIVVPAGFETDFASIPWGLWNLFPPYGRWARAAIIHDFLYATRGTGVFEGRRWITRATDYTRKEADKIFLEAMEVVGVDPWRRTVMYRAVWAWGTRGWGS
jgi:hypothetical protein